MAVDAFLWFEPALSGMAKIQGESKDSIFGKDGKLGDTPAFEIKDFSFGAENPTTIGSTTGGAGAGKVKFNEFQIKKTSDRASPYFFKNMCAGAHYKNVQIEMRKAGGDPSTTGKTFMRFKFGTVFTTKIDWSGPGDEGPEESITFVYGLLGVTYYEQDETGAMTNTNPAGWDQIKNIDAQPFAKDPDRIGK